MANSDIAICNYALSLIGERPIRSFDEDNSRARLCKNVYDMGVELVLSRLDWPFARKTKQLNQALDADLYIPEGYAAYQIPSDCNTPLDVLPCGATTNWSVMGGFIITPYAEVVVLKYTKKESNVSLFSSAFVGSLAKFLAAQLAGPISGASQTDINNLNQMFEIDLNMAMTMDANIGGRTPDYDETPETDTFNSPGIVVDPFERGF